MGILSGIWKFLKTVRKTITSIRKTSAFVKDLSITERRELVRESYLEVQKQYTEAMKQLPRPKWEKFDTMVNDLIDKYDYDYDTAIDELKYMLETDEIDLDEGYIEFLREHDTP